MAQMSAGVGDPTVTNNSPQSSHSKTGRPRPGHIWF